jgi:hypothetical protein
MLILLMIFLPHKFIYKNNNLISSDAEAYNKLFSEVWEFNPKVKCQVTNFKSQALKLKFLFKVIPTEALFYPRPALPQSSLEFTHLRVFYLKPQQS